VGGILIAASLLSAVEAEHPNVLLIIADDLNDSVEGMGGHVQARTPHLDRLSRSSVQFLNAHANAPKCGPSRASFLTGLHPATTGYYGHQQQANHWRENPVLKDAVTLMEHFRTHGYAVFGTGKVFHNGHEDESIWEGADGLRRFGIAASFGPFPWDGQSRTAWGAIGWQPHPQLPESLQEFWGQGMGPLSFVPHYPPDPKTGVPGYQGWVLNNKPFHYAGVLDRDSMPDEQNADYVCNLLAQKHESPFMIVCGFNRPHTPLYAPDEYFDLFPLDSIKLPPYLENDLADCPEVLWSDYPEHSERGIGPGKFKSLQAAGDGYWQRWIQAYLACVAFVDAQVGRILEGLEQSPHRENTLVIFTSDHGYHMGEKDYLFKDSLWEESTRVPLLIRMPGRTVQRSTHVPVSLVDLYPTLNRACGLPNNPNVHGNGFNLDGRDILALATNDTLRAEEAFTVMAVAGDDPLGRNKPGLQSRQHWSLRTCTYRYVRTYTGEEELYDHRDDPHEWTNLAQDESTRELRRELSSKLDAFLSARQVN
jgi:arylsulfatase A-like enzyme